MKKLNLNQMENLNGGIVCFLPNENASEFTCQPNLCAFVDGIVGGTNAPIIPIGCLA